jgi:hypothetical protein
MQVLLNKKEKEQLIIKMHQEGKTILTVVFIIWLKSGLRYSSACTTFIIPSTNSVIQGPKFEGRSFPCSLCLLYLLVLEVVAAVVVGVACSSFAVGCNNMPFPALSTPIH